MDDDKLEQYRVKSLPASLYYINDFLTAEEEMYILNKIPPNKWISLSHRRLQSLPARLTASNALIASTDLPSWLLHPAAQRIADLGVCKDSPHGGANHCLINEYLPGQGIMPHEDGGAYYPVVATVSLGSSTVLDITAKPNPNGLNGDERQSWRIYQEPRSLLLTTGTAYTGSLHGIAEVEADEGLGAETVANWELLSREGRERIEGNEGRSPRETRVSLTFRDVLKVSKVGSKVFGRSRS